MIQHDITKWIMYTINVFHPLNIRITFVKFVFAIIFATIKYPHIICHMS
jgi:hypothetical protein